MKIQTLNNTYEVLNFKRNDGLFNTYVQRTSNLSNTYKGEAVYSIGSKNENILILDDVIGLKYNY